MRRIFTLILLCILVVSLVSCAVTPAESSEEPSEVSEDSSTEETSEESQPIPDSMLQVYNYLNVEVDRSLKAKNLFAGRSYTYPKAQPVDDTYTDSDNSKLTDGISRTVFDKYNWVAFKGVSQADIVFDLKDNSHALADIAVDTLVQESYGIQLPKMVRVYASNDGEDYTCIGSMHAPLDSSTSGFCTFDISLEKATNARYIKISISGITGFCFVGEVRGYEYCEDGTLDIASGETLDDEYTYDLYGYQLNGEVTVPVSSSDSDYDTVQNLALLDGVSITASHWDAMTRSEAQQDSGKDGLALLIDGSRAAYASYSEPEFCHFIGATGRHVVIDLGNVMSVSSVKGEFLGNVGAGIAVPAAIAVSVSTDGETWVTVGGDFTGKYTDVVAELYEYECKFAKEYKARYVRFSFDVKYSYMTTGMTYASELEVYGRKNTSKAVDAEYNSEITVGRYVETEESKCENIYLAAVGKSDGSSGYTITESNILSMVAYLDSTGTIQDTYFDSFLLSLSNAFSKSDVKENYSDFITEIFTEGCNLDALNKVAQTVSEALGREVRLSVWIALEDPFSSASGQTEQLELVKWEIDTFLKEYAKHTYSNLDFYGFYWLSEYIPKDNYAQNCAVISSVNAYIHKKGYRSFWCPYYGAYGIWDWKAVGFDFANYQPNYMFYDTTPTRLQAAAETAKLLGMSNELEIEDCTSEESIGKYREYVREQYDSGAMNSVKMYYVGGIPGAIAKSATSDSELSRSVYDDTYLLAKGLLDESYNQEVPVDLSGLADAETSARAGKMQSIELGVRADEVRVRVLNSPVFGSLRINNSGKISYIPYDVYFGSDTVVLEITSGEVTKTVTLTFTCTED